MAHEFQLPDFGAGQEEAEIVEWLADVGDVLTKGQPFCSVETAKSVIEIPAPVSGALLKIAGPVGTVIKIGDVLAVIGDPSEPPHEDEPPSPGSSDRSSAPPVEVLDGGGVAGHDDIQEIDARSDDPAASSSVASSEANDSSVGFGPRRPLATPKVRRAAQRHGLNITEIRGSGIDGEVTLDDVEAAAVAERTPGSGDSGSETRIRMHPLRRATAAHLEARWREVPHITCHLEADASRVLQARERLAKDADLLIPIDAILIAACVPGLRGLPEMNAYVDGEDLVVIDRLHIGFAVGTAEGLLVPVVHDADRLSIRDMSAVVSELSSRAIERRLAPNEHGSQSFTVSNAGPPGGGHLTQIVPSGTTAIVSFGRARELPVSRNGTVRSAMTMPVSGTFDHRAVDGRAMLSFMQTVIASLEEPHFLDAPDRWVAPNEASV